MLRKLISPVPVWPSGLACIRIITGLLMAYHGLEIFSRPAMEEYLKWDVIKGLPFPEAMVYLGKGLEFFTGLCFAVGLFTRVAALAMAANMLFICFKVGGGKFYYEDQHPFLFALIALVFFFAGPVKWSLDHLWFKNSSRQSVDPSTNR